MRLDDFIERVRVKFDSPSDLPMRCVVVPSSCVVTLTLFLRLRRYKDSEGTVSIIDSDDWEGALPATVLRPPH
jgi:hypothetical protein